MEPRTFSLGFTCTDSQAVNRSKPSREAQTRGVGAYSFGKASEHRGPPAGAIWVKSWTGCVSLTNEPVTAKKATAFTSHAGARVKLAAPDPEDEEDFEEADPDPEEENEADQNADSITTRSVPDSSARGGEGTINPPFP